MSGEKEIKAGVGYTIGNILIKGISFLSLPLFSRLLTPSQYGIFNTYSAYEALLAILLGIGMYASIKNAKYDYPGKTGLYVSTILRLTLYMLMIVGILVTIFRKPLTSFTDFPYYILVIMLFHSYGTALLSINNSVLALDYNYKRYLCIAFFNVFMSLGLSVVLILGVFHGNEQLGRIIGAATPMIMIALFVFISEGKKVRFRFDWGMAKQALVFGLPMVCHYLSQSVQSQIDRIMITKMVDEESTGIYSMAYSAAVILQVIYFSAENVWSVWFYEELGKKNYRRIRAVTKKYILLITAIAAVMLVGSQEFIHIWADRSYWSGAVVFIPSLLGIYMLFLYTIPACTEYYYKKTKGIAALTFLAAVINVVLNYILIKKFGYIAAAYATLASYAVTFIGHWIVSVCLQKRRENTVLFRAADFLVPLACLCLVGVAVSFLNPYPWIKYPVALVAFSVLCIVYRKDLKALLHMLKSKTGATVEDNSEEHT